MRKIIPVLLSAMVTTSLLVQNVCAAPALPDLFDIVSSAASDVLEAAGNAGANISDAAAQTGETVAGATKQVGELTSEVVSNVGKSVSEFSAQAGNVFADWSVQAQTTAEEVQKKLTKAGIDLQTNASAWGKATTDKASELLKNAGTAAENALQSVSGAADMVIDQAGNVVDMAAEGISGVTSAGENAARILQEKGEQLMQIVNEAIAGIDLADQKNWDGAKYAVDEAIEKASEAGVLGEHIDDETVHAVATLVFGVVMYSYQYSDGQINLNEYVSSLSEVIIKEGVPTGVGFVVSRLPLPIPNADYYAKEATLFLISKAYENGEKTTVESVESVVE